MKYQCPCCGYKTLEEPIDKSWGDICPVCFWEVDPFIKGDANKSSGSNHGLTLNQARENFKDFGACEKSMLSYVRNPNPDEL